MLKMTDVRITYLVCNCKESQIEQLKERKNSRTGNSIVAKLLLVFCLTVQFLVQL
jgi:hypothetical protein